MDFDIKVSNKKTRHGFIKGRIEGYDWFALVHKSEVNYGINPKTLKRGRGKIVRLCIYKEIEGEILEESSNRSIVKRLIYANYQREWDTLNSSHKEIVRRLVDYLERRYSLRVVK